jgi:WD40 repeat protein
MDVPVRLNPFPGLRSFEPDEDRLFFGRDVQVDALLGRLRRTRFLGVVGGSGSGKSSLVKSGLIPSLHSGYMAKAGSSWRVALLRPGGDPIHNLSIALNDPLVLGGDPATAELRGAFLDAALRRSGQGLVTVVREARIAPGDNVLIVVDQFEELFRFKQARADAGGRDEAVGFVKLLLEAARQTAVPIYVVLTMRSEFIGSCAEFPGLAEAVNEGQYLVPRMTRDELRLAITGPVAVGGGEIAPRLVTRVLNEVGDDPDQLPVLQHALMRTWDYWARNHAPDLPIDFDDYQAIGTMRDALSRHADEAYDELPTKRDRYLAEIVFRALTETTGRGLGLRRPCRMQELCETAEASFDEVAAVVDRFRLPGRSFLVPPVATALEPETIVDLSHESLMRLWRRLIAWTYEEARSAEIYRRLSQAAALHETGEVGLWRDPELQLAINWREDDHPTARWSRRYNPDFERASAFLAASQQARDAEVAAREAEAAEKERSRRRQIATAKRVTVVMSLLSLFAIAGGAFAFVQWGRATAARQKAAEEQRRADESTREAAMANVKVHQAEGEVAAKTAEVTTAQQKVVEAGQQAAANLAAAEQSQRAAAAAEADARANQIVAARSQSEAKRAQSEAQASKDQAVAEATRAERFARDAEAKAADATMARQRAVEEEERATRLASLALSRELAAKALGQFGEASRDVPALLARQAFLIAERNGGAPERDTNIYAGLQAALRLLAPNRVPVFRGHTDAVRALALYVPSPAAGATTSALAGGLLASGGEDGTVRIFAPSNPSAPATVFGVAGGSPVRSVAFDGSGRWLAAGAFDGTIRLWDRQNMKTPPIGFNGRVGVVSTIAFDRRGRLVWGGYDGLVQVWDRSLPPPRDAGFVPAPGSDPARQRLADRVGTILLDVRPQRVLSLGLNPDTTMMAVGLSDGRLLLRSLEERDAGKPAPQAAASGQAGGAQVTAVAFSPSGRTIAAGRSDGTLAVGPSGTGAAALMYRLLHRSGVTGLAFGRNLLASSSLDGTVRIWQVAQPGAGAAAETVDLDSEPIALSEHRAYVWAVVLSPNGDQAFSASADRTVRSQQTRVQRLAAEVCDRVRRDLTQEEWKSQVSETLEQQPTCPKISPGGSER